jgi:hypothetical protein
VADFNGDGREDIVVSNFFDNNVSVFFGNGNGTFQPKHNFAAGTGPFSLTVGDFNGDHHADIVTANYLDNDVSVLLGNGDGTFQEQIVSKGGDSPLSITTADFNSDGIADIALANEEGSLSVLLGNGNGSFQDETDYEADEEPNGVTVGDFNGDGILDLIVANHEGDNVSIFYGKGDGTFEDAVNVEDENGPTVVVVADFNGDGVADLITSNFHADSVSILMGIEGTPQILAVSTTSLPAGSVGTAYDHSVEVTGGTLPYAWSISGGSLPAGLSLNPSTGAITGTPTSAGPANFTIHLEDFLSASVDKALSIGINPPAPLLISTTSLPDGAVGSAYAQSVAVTGGVVPYTWSITVNTLPAGLTLDTSTGAITGTPTTIGSSTFTVHVADSASQTANQSLTLVVTPPPPLSITTTSFPAGIIGGAYSQTPVASGGTLPYHWTVSLGSLPAGLNLNSSTGAITGTPTTAATSNFKLHVTDGGVQSADKDLSIVVTPPATLTITTTSLPDGSVGGAYSQTAAATGGITPYTWSITSGSLPNGLSLNASTGAITGTPTAQGTANFNLHLTDTGVQIANQSLSIHIGPPILISTTTTLTTVTPANSSVFGHSVSLQAEVAPVGTTGSVTFMDGVTVLGTGLLDFSGVADFRTIALGPGPHSLHAVYVGDDTTYHLPSKSTVIPYAVQSLPGDEFEAAVNYGAGSAPSSVVRGDFNGDGKSDLAVTNYGSNNVSILLGNGNGTFHNAVNFAVGDSPYAVAIGDFNEDGREDLAVANQASGTVSVLLGNGNGTFHTAVNYSAGPGSTAISVGDFNGDGKADLVTANFAAGNASVLLGNGDGTFESAVSYGVGSGPFSVVIGDFNGDDKTDLAVANFGSDNVSVLLGNGNGTFQSAVNYGAGTSPLSIAAGYINNDSRLDLIVANFGSDNVSVLPGNSNGTFQPAVNRAVGAGPFYVISSDFNGDGKTDIATPNFNGGNASVLLGNGDATFLNALNFGAGSSPYSIAAGDFNGDGVVDLVVANDGSGNVSVLLGIPGVTNALTIRKAGNAAAQRRAPPPESIAAPLAVSCFPWTRLWLLRQRQKWDRRLSVGLAMRIAATASVTMSAARNCTATFNTLAPIFDDDHEGRCRKRNGDEQPAGINCGATCGSTFSSGQVVTLTATPANGSTFGTWSGVGCENG